MAANTDSAETRRKRRLVRFSLSTLLLLTMLAASYCAGWVSHRSWNRRNVKHATFEAMEAIRNMPHGVRIEYVGEVDVLMTTGRRDDVEKIEDVVSKISKIQEAAQQ